MGGWGECSQPGYGKGVFEEDDPVRGRTYFYDRKGTGGGLFVITPTPITFKEFVEVAGKMGKVSLQDKERFLWK